MAKLFKKEDDSSTVKVKRDDSDTDKIVSDKYTKAGSGKHVHESETADTRTGEAVHYGGGENSDDRSYNKKASKK